MNQPPLADLLTNVEVHHGASDRGGCAAPIPPRRRPFLTCMCCMFILFSAAIWLPAAVAWLLLLGLLLIVHYAVRGCVSRH